MASPRRPTETGGDGGHAVRRLLAAPCGAARHDRGRARVDALGTERDAQLGSIARIVAMDRVERLQAQAQSVAGSRGIIIGRLGLARWSGGQRGG